MKKVVYSVTKFSRNGNTKMTGFGYLTESDLLIACVSQNAKPYILVFEDCVKNCHPIPNSQNEFKGAHYEIREIEVTDKHGAKDTREITVDYSIWYKIVED